MKSLKQTGVYFRRGSVLRQCMHKKDPRMRTIDAIVDCPLDVVGTVS